MLLIFIKIHRQNSTMMHVIKSWNSILTMKPSSYLSY